MTRLGTGRATSFAASKHRRGGVPPPKPENLGSQRLLSAAAASDVHDTCLWMKLAEATGARGNSTALVGAPDTVAEGAPRLLQARRRSLLIRGYEPLDDAERYGARADPARSQAGRRDSTHGRLACADCQPVFCGPGSARP